MHMVVNKQCDSGVYIEAPVMRHIYRVIACSAVWVLASGTHYIKVSAVH